MIINKGTDFQYDIMIENNENCAIFKLISRVSLFSFTFFTQMKSYHRMKAEFVQGFKDRRFTYINTIYIKSDVEIKVLLETLKRNPLFNDKCIKFLEDHVHPVRNNRKFKEVKKYICRTEVED